MGVGTLRRNREEAERRTAANASSEGEQSAGPRAEQEPPKNPELAKLDDLKFADLQKEAEARGIDHKGLKLKSKTALLEAIQKFDEEKASADQRSMVDQEPGKEGSTDGTGGEQTPPTEPPATPPAPDAGDQTPPADQTGGTAQE